MVRLADDFPPSPPLERPEAAFPGAGRLSEAITRAQGRLLGLQKGGDGYWCGELRADTTLESDAVMLWNFLGRGDSPKIRRLAAFILDAQLPDGGWPIYRGGPAEVSATVKAYWALKFAGHSPEAPALARSRRRISELGGIHRVNTYTKFYLALFGQYDWRGLPSIPPEMVLLPPQSPFSLTDLSSWTRVIVLPLAIVWAKRPRVECPPHARLDELFPDARRFLPLAEVDPPERTLSWKSFFFGLDSLLKGLDGRAPRLRAKALDRAECEMLRLMEGSDGLGAIYPGILNAVLAMKALGYPDDHPVLAREVRMFEALELDRGDRLEMQPSLSAVWDTAIACIALAESGLDPAHPALTRAARWLLSKEVQRPGGWAFQFNNPWYPDVDDTAMVLLALRRIRLAGPLGRSREEACGRAVPWLLSMQGRGGGWGAFDRDNDKTFLASLPFADHNAVIDPPTADVTARLLELLGGNGSAAARRAQAWLEAAQEIDGSWFGRWGVNYLYGTWQALRGLAAVGAQADPSARRGAAWLRSVQRPDGGWGETCRTYDDAGLKGAGPSTPSQTAWAMMGLLAAGASPDDPAVDRGVRHLLETQRIDGGWDEEGCTGTGFPKVFYLEYTLYRDAFPLMALGEVARKLLRSGVRLRRTVAGSEG